MYTVTSHIYLAQVRSQPVFSGKPKGPFYLSRTFIFRNERNRMEKSARASEKLVSPSLPGLQVATRLLFIIVLSGGTSTCSPMYRRLCTLPLALIIYDTVLSICIISYPNNCLHYSSFKHQNYFLYH